MWSPKVLGYNDSFEPFDIVNGLKPALVIKNFYSKKDSDILANRISQKPNLVSQGKIKTVGPFLMSFATRKEDYFEQSAFYEKTFSELFSNLEDPVAKIKKFLGNIFPSFSFEFATENNKKYSKCVIRIHENNDHVPVHKDNVSYEGINYAISNIDFQISCVIHLQEATNGGEVVIYKKQWSKNDEVHRKIDFGYDAQFLGRVEHCKIIPQKGDLVIINPNYFHGVNEVKGNQKRITLGVFAGFDSQKGNAFLWS